MNDRRRDKSVSGLPEINALRTNDAKSSPLQIAEKSKSSSSFSESAAAAPAPLLLMIALLLLMAVAVFVIGVIFLLDLVDCILNDEFERRRNLQKN